MTFPVIDWLEGKGVRLRDSDREIVRRAFEEGARAVRPASTARWRMRKKGLPPLTDWQHAGKALRAAQAIHAHPDTPISRIDFDGYTDHTGPYHALGRVFGASPADVRRAYDPADLMDRWWERATRRPAMTLLTPTER